MERKKKQVRNRVKINKEKIQERTTSVLRNY